jgi:hypothetical protein
MSTTSPCSSSDRSSCVSVGTVSSQLLISGPSCLGLPRALQTIYRKTLHGTPSAGKEVAANGRQIPFRSLSVEPDRARAAIPTNRANS